MPDPLPPIDLDDGPAGRILATAREIMLRETYSGLTMDGLAFALGMSKKTIYQHFPSKQAIVSAIMAATGDTVRRRVMELLAAPTPYADKLEAVFRVIASYFATMSPAFVHDVERHAPHVFAEINAIKERNIPLVFGRLLAMGVEEGMVRADIDVAFLTEYWLQMVKAVHEPALLTRTGTTPREAFEKALDLFFCGLLTPEGRARTRWAAPASERG
ncbi:TetR/AcrR family transcriptional regulator [Azorhizobium doebereinerae]|uniref:TetR/AcrR family transcriptional regulator n=1 Tax=Azorhizobium doebereinerae TaxID=281091 RepID=UPI00041696EE|nr:TetR/AcrR family transcriptional regulator [Azorhizobium doebereinerae]